MVDLLKKSALLLYALFVGVLSLQPAQGPGVEHLDKVVHFSVYALFTVLAFVALRTTRSFYRVCTAIVIYGGLLEVAQSFAPERSMSLYDFVANTSGVVVTAILIKLIQNRGFNIQ